ncbi:MAG: class I SAM-dependent methyltransferase [Thermoleophilia bacterium]
MHDVASLFDRFAGRYDASRRRLVPHADLLYETAVEVATLRLPDGRAPRILDLGAGTGLLTAVLAGARPDATFVLLDASAGMLERAPALLGDAWSRCEAVVGDMAGELPAGPFDAIVSALAIHHVDDAGKQGLFGRIHERLAPGAPFVDVEQVAGPTPALDGVYVERWLAQTTALGTTPDEHHMAHARMAADLPASVDDQLGWLREAGFVDVDCVAKHWRFAVLVGWRAPGPGPAAAS